MAVRHGAVRDAAERGRQARAAAVLVRPPARPSSPFPPRGLTRGRGRSLSDTALSGTLPSDIANLTQLRYLCAPARPSSPFSPRGLIRGRGRNLYNTALSGTLPKDIGKLGQLERLCAPARPPSPFPPGA
eukprot:SAG25_NODE_66_length_17563_cov_34.737918_16_plen_130_part_00